MTEALGRLLSARARLEVQLAAHDAWRALSQLRERELRGEDLASLDARRLKASLEQTLDQVAPYWRALDDLDQAMRLLSGVSSQSAAVEAPASPVTALPVPPGSPRDVIRPRFKIKAGSSLVERVPRVEPLPSGPESGPVSDAVEAAPTTASPATGNEAPASPVSGADSLQQRLKAAWPAREEEAAPPPTSHVPRLEALPGSADEPMRRPNQQDRLAAIEADLDTIMGLSPQFGAHEKGRQTPGSNDADEFVEAEVEIVSVRRELQEPEAGGSGVAVPGTAAPVALSIRLKQDERSAEFDREDWAAYRTDVGEAEIEIVTVATAASTEPTADGASVNAPEASAPRTGGREVQRFLKALTGD